MSRVLEIIWEGFIMGCNCNNGFGSWLILLILLCGCSGNGGLMGGCCDNGCGCHSGCGC